MSRLVAQWALMPRVGTLALALAGAASFRALGLPLPFLFGPMAFCLVAALLGARLKGLGQISVGARTILGVAVGASITPEVVGQIPQMAMSVALVPLYVGIIGLIGVPFFRRLGFDPATSYYAAMPGGLQDMVIFGQEAGADVRALSLIHATRVAVLVTLAPVILVWLYDAPLSGAMGAPLRGFEAGPAGLDGPCRADRLEGGRADRPLRRLDPGADDHDGGAVDRRDHHAAPSGRGDHAGAAVHRPWDRRAICRRHPARAARLRPLGPGLRADPGRAGRRLHRIRGADAASPARWRGSWPSPRAGRPS